MSKPISSAQLRTPLPLRNLSRLPCHNRQMDPLPLQPDTIAVMSSAMPASFGAEGSGDILSDEDASATSQIAV